MECESYRKSVGVCNMTDLPGHGVWGSGFRVQGSGIDVQGLGFRV